jgi:hypothetical protein
MGDFKDIIGNHDFSFTDHAFTRTIRMGGARTVNLRLFVLSHRQPAGDIIVTLQGMNTHTNPMRIAADEEWHKAEWNGLPAGGYVAKLTCTGQLDGGLKTGTYAFSTDAPDFEGQR